MKVDIIRRRRAAVTVAGCCLAVLLWATGAGAVVPLGHSERPEAYFNGSSFLHIRKPISLKQLVGLSFRTCVGGELFTQRFERYTLHVTALFEQVVVSWALPTQATREVGLAKGTLDNRWHWVALRYHPSPPSLMLEVDHDSQVISNVTWNPELLTPGTLDPSDDGALVVGNVFSGCIHEGPQIEFYSDTRTQNVVFGTCPLTTDECIDRKDVLRIPPKDHCYNEPCMRHGTCISRHDRYECHCTARYTGNNCEVDAGDPCRSQPCQHGGRCVETARGDYTCSCTPNYHGQHCELEVSLDPLCVEGPCRNNGSCSVPPGADSYVCSCPAGYTGRNCETDVDECALAAGACLNGGRCVDDVNNYTCNCNGTGYTGPRCELNINECAEDEHICGNGVCYDTYGSYVCACLPGYTGEHCHSMSACASGPCGLGGACVEESGGSGFRCVCARGWAPPLCAQPVPPPQPMPQPQAAQPQAPPVTCADIVCPPRSHCARAHPGMPSMVTGVILAKQVTCVCDQGYYGAPGPAPNCTSAEAACAAGACLHGGACAVVGERLDCTCAPGYRGAYCELEAGTGAGAGASAGAGTGTGKALSELKALGERCAAAPPPCLRARACHDLPMGFRCECEPGWTGLRCDVPEACGVRGCLNGGTCREPDGACECPPGFTGAVCEAPLDCRASSCPHAQDCMEQNGVYRCVPAPTEPACTGMLCDSEEKQCELNSNQCNFGVCLNQTGKNQCFCKPGYTGDFCDQDIDECLSSPCKNGGECTNLENNYSCTCMDGYAGKDCSVNIDECATSPCAAGSTCVDGVASFTCVCQDGLTGPTCAVDIDDCESQPCLHGGVCQDALNGYSCVCAGTGYAGADCALNIDECAPQPCRHGGSCVDDLNDYRCLCHPGYTGKNCEVDINECEVEPCKHGGVCLERSNTSLYRAADAPPLAVGPQPAMLLPRRFYQPFSYDDAAGYECVCVAGTRGRQCEENVDECLSSPCDNGKCVDHVGGYECDCAPGYEGRHCNLEINECLIKPCAHGHCVDGRATYYCSCEPGWGGRNCSVVLQGCRGDPCRNHGTCLPWLRDETRHLFNCSCAPGYYGRTCEKITTMSLEKSSYAEVNTSREEGYDISFRFKTTLGNGLLAMGRGLTYFFLELSNGRLNLHSSLLNKWEGVFIGSNLNDSNWQKVFVTINSSHLVLAANEEQTIYPIISQSDPFNSSVTSFPSTRLGTAGSSYAPLTHGPNFFVGCVQDVVVNGQWVAVTYAPLTHGPNFFVGCVQDVVVNGQWVLPEDSNATSSELTTESSSEPLGSEEAEGEAPEAGAGSADGGALRVLHRVSARCPRTPQCAPNPCRSGGACEDHWTSFVCACPRPHLGDTCQYNYTAATFGQEAAKPRSLVVVQVSPAARRGVRAALDISMFVRTRKPTGQIFYLGSLPREGQEETQVSASLWGGELLVHLRFNQTSENYTVGGTRLDNGHLHLIEVVRNATLVQVKLNGTEYFRKSISAAKQLDASVLYLGGPPPPDAGSLPPSAAPAAPAAPVATATPAAPLAAPVTTPAPASPAPEVAPVVYDDSAYFKGVIQDVQVSNGVNVTIVEFFPLQVEGLTLPPPFGSVWLDPRGVLAGAVSDDACASGPCLHNASCANTWNDYACACPRGYKGKQCAEVEFCQLQGCPLNSHCRNLDNGYECVSNATFDGANTTLSYRLRVPPDTLDLNHSEQLQPPETLTITYRTKVGGTLFHAESIPAVGDSADSLSWFTVSVFGGAVGATWRVGGARLPALARMRTARPHHWTTVRFSLVDDHLVGVFVDADGVEEPGMKEPIDAAAWQQLVLHGDLHLGGVGPRRAAPVASTVPPALMMDNATDSAVWEYSEGDEFAAENSAGLYFKGCMGAVHVGGLLLPFFTEEQLFVGAAAALLAAQPHYKLMSGQAWGASAGVGCILCLEQDCARGGHCADLRNSFACACPPGYSGDYCQIDIDECAEHQCQNGATCKDGVASYSCICPEGFEGDMCEIDIDECASSPCLHGGTCADGAGAFRCACAHDWRGARCQLPRERTCAHLPCAPGRADCRDVPPDPPTGNNYTCTCYEGFEGVHCETAFCEAEPCQHGTCNTDNKMALCVCEEGYSGRLCERERNTCAELSDAAACRHGGRCRPRRRGHVCDCAGTGWTGAQCEIDVDECAGGVSCGPGECVNLEGSYTCLCSPGFCGNNCALRDPCFEPFAADEAENATLGPCRHGGRCEQRCTDREAYVCHCVDGWGGHNCTHQAVSAGASGGVGTSPGVLIGVGAALLALALLGAGVGALAAQARRKRATRGTYSPSGQEYCNPRAEMMHHALKPPPEERLI